MKAILLCGVAAFSLLGAAFGEDRPKEFTVHPIGIVENEGDKTAVVIEAEYAKGLRHLDRYSHVWVIWWFDKNDNEEDRSMLKVIPRGNDDNGVAGVFATRSQYRPNLIAMTLCKIESIKGTRIELESIDAFDGTPVLDLKPYIPAIDDAENARTAEWKAEAKSD